MANSFSNILQKYKTGIVIGALVLSLAYIAGMGVFQYILSSERTPPEKLITFKNLPSTIEMSAVLKNRQGTTPLLVQDGSIMLTASQRTNFLLPYEVTATLKDSDDQYHDIVWSLDSKGISYAVRIDGYSPEDTVSFSLNGSSTVVHAPLDWSGRLTLEAFLLPELNNIACVAVEVKKAFSFCHVLTGERIKA